LVATLIFTPFTSISADAYHAAMIFYIIFFIEETNSGNNLKKVLNSKEEGRHTGG